ncbi:MAG: HAD family hydrolase [Candidatus Nanopelagicales bacterium]
MANQYEFILFDLDGTLTDAGPGILNCIEHALSDQGIEYPERAAMRSFLGPPLAVTFREHFNMSDAQITQAIDKYRERYHDVGMFENSVYDGVPELLQSLQASGIRMATATSKPEYSATRILQHFELDQYFEFIGASSLDGSRDSKASVIKHTLATTGAHPTKDSMIMVGDRHHDIDGAREHGINTIGVLWGYGDHDELSSAGATEIVHTPQELLAVLTRA